MINKSQSRLIFQNMQGIFLKLFLKNENKKLLQEKGKNFLGHLNIPKLSEDRSKLCEKNLTEKHLYDSLKRMQKDKSPSNNNFKKEFYETFWKELKKSLQILYHKLKKKGI